MKKKLKIGGLSVVLLFGVACLVIWLMCRNPYESQYFTVEMQAKYPTLESVLDAFRIGWKYDTAEHVELLNEVYGFKLADRYGDCAPREDAMDEINRIAYSKDRKLAFVLTDRSGWMFVMRKNRWVFYPETPWGPLVEMIHSR
ncbi:hypothetical protein ACFLSJ_06970 [Verrucomicrobiota bacterium]